MHLSEQNINDNDGNDRDDEKEENLPSHTLSMRKAVQKCARALFYLLPEDDIVNGSEENLDERKRGEKICVGSCGGYKDSYKNSRGNKAKEGEATKYFWLNKFVTVSSGATKEGIEENIRRRWLQLYKEDHFILDGISECIGLHKYKDATNIDSDIDMQRHAIQRLRDSSLEEATVLHSRRCESLTQFWRKKQKIEKDKREKISSRDQKNICELSAKHLSNLTVNEGKNIVNDGDRDDDAAQGNIIHPIDIVYIRSPNGKQDATIEHQSDQDESVLRGDITSMRSGDNGKNEDLFLTPLQFKRRYIYRNIPCVIRGLDQEEFYNVTNLWRRKKINSIDSDDDNTIPEINCDINIKWFQEHVGENEMVPVRKSPISVTIQKEEEEQDYEEDHGLDEDGRAVECQTIYLTMSNWIKQCLNKSVIMDPSMYLKDWHLMQFLEQQQQRNETPIKAQLYKVPQIFQHDLLNTFLMEHTKGDYRFVYWGPVNSYTGPHTDVLHSFSWSYNVAGEKLWTFYPPSTTPLDSSSSSNGMAESKPFRITQQPGETIFVPSQWKHDVRNIQHSTLSINHNWITTANIDLAWDCVVAEVYAVEEEMNAWCGESETFCAVSNVVSTSNKDDCIRDIHDNDLEDDDNDLDYYTARENMVRGCCGLDVTSFLLMVITSMADCLDVLFGISKEQSRDDNIGVFNNRNERGKNNLHSNEKNPMAARNISASAVTSSCGEDIIWESLFSLFRLQNVLRQILSSRSKESKHRTGKNESARIKASCVEHTRNNSVDVHVHRRLRAVLFSKEYALCTMEMASFLVQIVDILRIL